MLCSDLEDNDKDIAALDIVLDKCLTELNLEERVKITCQPILCFLLKLVSCSSMLQFILFRITRKCQSVLNATRFSWSWWDSSVSWCPRQSLLQNLLQRLVLFLTPSSCTSFWSIYIYGTQVLLLLGWEDGDGATGIVFTPSAWLFCSLLTDYQLFVFVVHRHHQ